MTELEIRQAEEHDLPRLVEIYNHYVEHTAITFDTEVYTVESRRAWFDSFGSTGRYRLLVGIRADVVVGYACTGPLRGKRAYDPSVETTIYIDPAHTRGGIGRQLYAALLECVADEDIHRAYAGITLPNEGSVKLHEQFGFESVGVWEQVGRKFDRFWDVLWMAKPMGDACSSDS